MKYDTCLVPSHGMPVPADLRGKRQALFFLLKQSRPIADDISQPQDSAHLPQMPRPEPTLAAAQHRLSTILGSDDFQFTF